MQEDAQVGVYNVVVIGVTGVGKSELVNYLFGGKKVAKTGVGLPVTKRGFKQFPLKLNELKLNLYDSWGLEIGNLSPWTDLLEKELEEHGLNKPAQGWIHTILYCINAAGKRIQPEEVQILRRLEREQSNLIILLTQADLIGKKAEAKFISKIQEAVGIKIPILPVCSISTERRDAPPVKEFGRKEILTTITNQFWGSIVSRLPARCRIVVETYLLRHTAKNNSAVLTKQCIKDLVRKEITDTFATYNEIISRIETLKTIDNTKAKNCSLFPSIGEFAGSIRSYFKHVAKFMLADTMTTNLPDLEREVKQLLEKARNEHETEQLESRKDPAQQESISNTKNPLKRMRSGSYPSKRPLKRLRTETYKTQ